jgi:hypothetical protein
MVLLECVDVCGGLVGCLVGFVGWECGRSVGVGCWLAVGFLVGGVRGWVVSGIGSVSERLSGASAGSVGAGGPLGGRTWIATPTVGRLHMRPSGGGCGRYMSRSGWSLLSLRNMLSMGVCTVAVILVSSSIPGISG